MAKMTVGAAPQRVAGVGQTPVVQNLGPGILYLDTRPDVTAATGLKVAVDDTYEMPRDLHKDLYVVADTEGTDVRVMMVG